MSTHPTVAYDYRVDQTNPVNAGNANYIDEPLIAGKRKAFLMFLIDVHI